jgi:hypothetical protein
LCATIKEEFLKYGSSALTEQPIKKGCLMNKRGGKVNTLKLTIEWSPYLGQMTWEDMRKKLEELNGPYQRGKEPKWRLPTEDEFRYTSSTQPNAFRRGDGQLIENAGNYWVGPNDRRGTAGWFSEPGKSCFGSGSDGRNVPHHVRFVSFCEVIVT